MIFLILLLSGFQQTLSYGYMYLVVFLWLGFWLKLTVHIILGYPFVESVGAFLGTPDDWDHVLLIATLAALGALLGRYLLRRFSVTMNITGDVKESLVPTWFFKNRKICWLFLLIFIVMVAVLNVTLGIEQIGMVPEYILPWPLNAVIAWLITIGLAMGVATVVWWEICLGNGAGRSFVFVVIEGVAATTSLMSRGIYLFHIVPQVVALAFLGVKRLKVHWLHVFMWSIAVLVLFVASIAYTSSLRSQLFVESAKYTSNESAEFKKIKALEYQLMLVRQQVTKTPAMKERMIALEKMLHSQHVTSLEGKTDVQQETTSKKRKKVNFNDILASQKDVQQETTSKKRKKVNFNDILASQKDVSKTLVKISQLAVDRWIGLEGLLAVYSYPNKGAGTLWKGLLEAREIGKVDMFQEVSKSLYRYSNVKKYQFAGLPGMVAFLYYSGSGLVVFFGMLFVVCLLVGFEVAIMKLTQNPILCSLLGFSFANIVAQFGLCPRQMIPYFIMVTIAVVMIGFAQKIKLAKGDVLLWQK